MKLFFDSIKKFCLLFFYVIFYLCLLSLFIIGLAEPSVFRLIYEHPNLSLLTFYTFIFIAIVIIFINFKVKSRVVEVLENIAKFNGWQRIQFVLSVGWAIFVLGICIIKFEKINSEGYWQIFLILVIPIAAVWLIPNSLIFVFKWIADGFKKNNNP